MAGNIKGIIVEIGGDTSGLQQALSKVNSATSSLSKELKGINSLLKLDPSNTELLAQKQTVLKENIENTSEKLRQLEEIQRQYLDEGKDLNTAEYRNLQREIEATKQKLSALKAENSIWTKMGDSLVDLGTKMTKVSSKIENLGTNLTNKLTLPILAVSSAIGTKLVKSSIDFESAFTGVAKTVDGTDEQLQKIKQGIKDMAKVLPSSTTEIAAVAEAAGQLGIKTDDILEFTKVMIDLGNSTNLSADEAASSLAKFANITKMSSKDYSKLGSVIVDLGNNFATTERDIVDMSTRLASTGKLTGLTEAQIMALATAMSSVGIEAEAGGSAMSKLLKKMQTAVETGSKDLEKFAKVSGMTSKEFKKAFQEDAVKALSAFLGGLNDTTRNGKSAIGILNDMNITEVRLSNTVLALASNSELLNNAVDTANKAWSDNSALSNEANKRYETLASKVEITKNNLTNLAIETGDKLTPTISKLLDKVNNLIDDFSGLSEEEIKNIIQTTAVVAAIGPAITIIGKLGSALGTGITTIGNFSKAIGNVANGVKVAEGQVGTFTTILGALTSPVGLVTTAIVALTAATAIYAKTHHDQITGLNGLREEVDKQRESWEKLKESRDKQLESSIDEIGQLENLKDELADITLVNGKVKEGYENRASVIVNQLNSALGTEIALNGNVIENYQDIQLELKKLITQKKADALLTAYAEEYAAAMKNQAKAVETLIDLKQQFKEKSNELVTATGKERGELELTIATIAQKIGEQSNLISEYGYTVQNYEALQKASVENSEEALKAATDRMGISWERAKTQASESLQEQIKTQEEHVQALKASLQEAQTAHDGAQAYIIQKQIESEETRLKNLKEELVKTETLTTDTQKYLIRTQAQANKEREDEQNNNSKKMLDILNQYVTTDKDINGSFQSYLTNLQSNSNTERKNEEKKTNEEMLKNLQEHLQTKTTISSETNETILKDQIKTETEMLSNLKKSLADAKREHNDKQAEIIQDQIKSSQTRLNNLTKELQNTSGKINSDTSVQNASSNLANRATTNFSNNNKMPEKMIEAINGIAGAEYTDGNVGAGAARLAGEANSNFNNNVHGHQWGSDLSNNISNGIISSIGSVAAAAARVASTISSYLHHSVPDEGPLADEMNYMPDMIDNLVKTLLRASPKLENASAEVAQRVSDNFSFAGLGSGINQKIIDGTKTVFTTPQIVFNVQELDETKLQQCFNYVNRKFGSSY